MTHTQERGTEAWWTETGAEEWADAIVAAMKLGGVDNLFFVSGSELSFYQEAIAKAQAKGRPAPLLVTMTHEHVALNAALRATCSWVIVTRRGACRPLAWALAIAS